jgi:hypothetical protein
MAGHALLSPSSASRWLKCTPAPRLEAGFADTSSRAADEGTLAHHFAELRLNAWFNKDIDFDGMRAYKKAVEDVKAHKLYAPEMAGYVEEYVSAVIGAVYPQSKVFIEKRVKFHEYVEEGEGTADAIIITGRLLDFWDLKYGKGVEVSAIENVQLMLYALGAYLEYSFMYDLDQIRLNIFQPRLGNHSVWMISIEDLLKWAEDYLRPRAKLAFEGEGEFAPSTDTCRFCKAAGPCRALAEYNLELAKKSFERPDLLSDEEVLDIYRELPLFKIFQKKVHAFVYAQALGGKKWAGLKIVEGKSNRKFKDPEAIQRELFDRVYGQEIFEPKTLYGLTALKGIVSKQDYKEVVEPNLIKPPGKPTLVDESDDRPEYSSADSAFATPYEDDGDSED